MKKLLFRIAGVLVALGAPLMVTSVARAAADTCTWTGAGSADIFSDSANWGDGAGPIVECDGAGIPENGDTLVFPTSVDSDTTFGDDRDLNNDLVSMTFAGITVTGTYASGDSDYYSISGNAFSLSGSLIGYTWASDSSPQRISLSVPLTLTQPTTVRAVYSTAGLTIASGTTTVDSSRFTDISGSGDLNLADSPAAGGAGGGCSVATSYPFSGNGSGFSGDVVVASNTFASTVASSTSFLRNAGQITVNGGTLAFVAPYHTDMTFPVNISLVSGSTLQATQDNSDPDCDSPTELHKVTLTGIVVATGEVDVRLYNKTNLELTGSVTGGDFIDMEAGLSKDLELKVGSTVKKSALLSTTYSVSDSNAYPYASENQEVIINAGVTVNNVSISGGTLKGVGTVGQIFLTSGVIAPGLSPGCLNSGNLNYSGGTLNIEINGSTVCTEYDQQVVTGTVSLGTATTLDIDRLTTYRPALNSTYTIISNDSTDAVTGTFSGLAQGATLTVDGVTYTISYTGGDGNDVVLTVTGVDASVGAPNTGANVIKSGIILPLLAMFAAVGIIAINFVVPKRSKK